MKAQLPLLAIALALAGCDGTPRADAAICTWPTIKKLGDDLEPISKARWCVHRWAYKLAPSREPVSVVADATIGACLDELRAAQNEAVKNKNSIIDQLKGNYGEDWAEENYNIDKSIFTGREINIEVKFYEELRAQAAFRVVQARAGHCSPDT